jgi:histidyl-tRNA synthetase
MTLQAIKGMNDILPQDIHLWHFFEQTAKACLKQFGYQEIRTPILEYTDVFVRGIGEVTDIVEKEMYSFSDALNGEHLTLRPEGTAAAVRCVIQHHLLHDGGKKLWYCGPMFRHERPQRGRYRQFHQMGIECLGFAHAHADVELILLTATLFKRLGIINKITLHINSLGDAHERQQHKQALVAYFEAHIDVLDEDSLKRLKSNPLRILDSKNPSLQNLIMQAPKILDFLQADSLAHFELFKQLLNDLDITYHINHRLVRGLDYYNRTVFEWITDELGAQGTICGGGRYDPLIESMGGKPSPAVGLAMGIERILELIKLTQYTPQKPMHIYLIHQGYAASLTAFKIAQILRAQQFNVLQHTYIDLEAQSLKAQMKKAVGSQANYAIILTDTHIEQGIMAIKNLITGEERIINIEAFESQIFSDIFMDISTNITCDKYS